MGYKFKDTLHNTIMACELNGKWELTYMGKLVVTRVNAEFVEDLQFFHELGKVFTKPFDELVQLFIQRREEMINDVTA